MEITSETSFSEEEELEFLLLSALRSKRKRRMWVCKFFFSGRRAQGEYHNLLQEMRFSDQESHVRYLRMSRQI